MQRIQMIQVTEIGTVSEHHNNLLLLLFSTKYISLNMFERTLNIDIPTIYEILVDGQSLQLTLSHKLIAYESKECSDEPNHKRRWAVLGFELARGGQGHVYDVIGTLKFINRKLVFEAKNKRVMKFIRANHLDIGNNLIIDSATHETNILNDLLAFSHVKQLVKPTAGYLPGTLFKKFHGLSLNKLLRMQDHGTWERMYAGLATMSNPNPQRYLLNRKQQFAIILAISQSLQYIHHNKIAHGDLKPENMIIDMDKLDEFTNQLNVACCLNEPVTAQSKLVRIIDFGLSLNRSKNCNGAKLDGTPAFMPPEYIENPTKTFAGDTWAFAKIIILILSPNKYYFNHFMALHTSMNGIFYLEDENNEAKIGKSLSINEIFGKHALPHEKYLYSFLQSMYARNPLDRPSNHTWAIGINCAIQQYFIDCEYSASLEPLK